MSDSLHIVTLPGDGIGPEVMEQALRVLHAALKPSGISTTIEEIPCGGKYFLEHGTDWPEGSQERCAAADLVLLGAVGWPSPDGDGPVTMPDGKMAGYSAVIGNRLNLQLYANVRPVKLFPGVPQQVHGEARSIWKPELVDMVFVRENTEGLYTGVGGRVGSAGTDIVAVDNRIITRANSERVIRYALELARGRERGAPGDGVRRVTCVVKDNVMEGCRLFRDVFFELAADYPELTPEKVIVDAFTQFLVRNPEHYNVVVTTNMFGDIVTDLAAVLQGGMGMAVGCNVGDEHGMFEPIHGSAPPLAGKGVANPMAMILAAGEGLSWVAGRRDDKRLRVAGSRVERAVRAVLEEGAVLPADLSDSGQGASTRAVTDAVIRQLGEA